MAAGFREDSDALGKVKVPVDALYSAQTQRSTENFPFGVGERQPVEIIDALAVVKMACAKVNQKCERMDTKLANAIVEAANNVRTGLKEGDSQILDSFPLAIWQTGSGTQSNMNINEVLSNVGNQILGVKELGSKKPIHPNDHCNLGQSSNDVFPSAISVAVTEATLNVLVPKIDYCLEALRAKVKEFESVIKIGRTHLMDAVPMTLGQEFSAYVSALEMAKEHIINTVPYVSQLALGGTAVGTGLNSFKGFDEQVCEEINNISGRKGIYKPAPNKFLALSQITPLVALSGAITTLATALLKMANDIRLLASGPRAGLSELVLPANEPGSSIMPGKVNPTQCESLAMVCTTVVGCLTSVANSNGFGHLQLNVFLPSSVHHVLRSIRLLGISMTQFSDKALAGCQPNHQQIQQFVSNSLMLVTCLTPHVGYDKAAEIAKNAHNKGTTLRESALELKAMTAEEFDTRVDPSKMI